MKRTGFSYGVFGLAIVFAAVGLAQQPVSGATGGVQGGAQARAGDAVGAAVGSAVGAAVGSAVVSAIGAALVGDWVGVLEYRDYQSDGRVKLPTWLDVRSEGQGLRFHYVYDDGPTKVVQESELATFDADKATYTVLSKPGEAETVYTIAGLEKLKSGRGTLILTGAGTDNDRAVEVRTTLKIGRNVVEMLRETRLPGEEFKFRHVYTFTRKAVPAVMVAAH
jgi:hypothetical protein